MTNFIQYLPQILSGISITLVLMMASVGTGFLLAMFLTICSLSEITILRKSVGALIFFVRGTPLLVQIFLIYYGVGQFEWIRETSFWIVLREPMACAIIALSLNSACYTAVLLQGAIHAVPKNEIDACHAMGMSKWLAFRRIIFPRALRLALPGYSNEVLLILKGTSLASTITLLDVMGVIQKLIAQTYQTVELYLIAGCIYLILNAIVTSLFSWMIKRSSIPFQTG